jgi:hypothetical protein
VFVRAGDAWVEEAMLAPRQLEGATRFGASVGISGDRIIVGAPALGQDFDEGPLPEGAAYVYRRSAGAWTEDAALTSSGPAEPEFGGSVAISGETAAVGASGAAERVHVFELREQGWTPVASLASGLQGGSEHFGTAVALKGDTIVVGAPGYDSHAGAAYIFARVSDRWQHDVRVVAPSTAEASELAGAVALSDGTILLGASGDSSGGTAAGAAYAVSTE